MRKNLRFVLFFIFLSINLIAQQNPKIDRETFFSKTDGVEQAKRDFKKADKYYGEGKGTYDEALKYYLKLYAYNHESKALNYKIAICYLFSSDKKASLKYLLESSSEISKDYYLALGRSYQYNKQYEQAKEAYDNYLNSLKKWKQHEQQSLIKQYKAECDYSQSLVNADSAEVFIVNLGPIINSYYDDYCAYLPPNDSNIFFTTKRPEEEPKKRVSRFKYHEQIYMASNCLYSPCQWVSGLKALNANTNVSMAGVDKSEHRIFFYEGRWHNGRILMTSYKPGKGWKKIMPIKGKINHIAFRETSISIGPDNTAYLVSDRQGSYGGKDIWVAKYRRNDKWKRPKNMGSVINTPFDEEGVYISDDGNTLYFSSKGHPGMGGFDVYKTLKQPDGSWSKPINLGYPINSPADELFYHPTRDTMIALYSTIRHDSYGGLDIYKVQKDPRKPFRLIGSVTDSESGEILQAIVNILDLKTSNVIYSTQVDLQSGIYMIDFEDEGLFSLQIDKEGYKSVTDTIECPQVKRSTIVLDYTMELIKHPFTLAGTITDVDNHRPVPSANIIFKDTISSIIYGRQFSDSLGRFSMTFEDKYDLIVSVDAKDYFSAFESVNGTVEPGSIITKNISLQRSRIDYTLTGVITNEEQTEAIHGALSFYLPNTDVPFAIVVSDSTNGKYSAVFEESGPFLIEVEANGYFFLNETYQFPDNQTFVAKNFILKKMSTGAKIVVENILFNSGKSTLKPESFKSLDKLAELLMKNPGVRIEVSGHTDNVGSSSVNKKISKARALTVKNYLVSRGIESERIEYEGYGFDQPIAPNDSEEGRSQNRRVEIKVLE